MIQPKPVQGQPPGWKQLQADAVRDPAELLSLLALDASQLPALRDVTRPFPLRVPRGFVARMQKGDPNDPLLRQVLPLQREDEAVSGFVSDPLQESAFLRQGGLLQKYRGRALLTVTGACGIHCRYCFRRHFPYADENPRQDWPAVLDALRESADVEEIIFSGGDPLLLDTAALSHLTDDLAGLPNLRRFRIHTRQAVVLPERIDQALLAWLAGLPFDTTMVVHVNHPNEIDPSVVSAMAAIRATGVTLLNQSVLLRGINDNASVLKQLSETLFAAGILPYYLHLLDPVAGAAHFDVPRAEAIAIWQELHASLSGYLVPRLVREIPESPGKSLIIG